MTDREELIYRAARALDTSRAAEEEQHAADEAHSTPENAATIHWQAAALCQEVANRLMTVADRHTFAAKRMEAEQRRELATGREYRRGDAA